MLPRISAIGSKVRRKGKSAALVLALCVATLALSAHGAIIQYESADLTDTTPGMDLWQYSYRVSDFTFAAGQGFTILFDRNLFKSLQSPPPLVSAGWDAISLQPDLALNSDGFYDALALINSPSLTDAFTINFVWLGTGSPATQPFTIYNTNFAPIEQGQTVPESGTATLLLGGFGLLMWHRRRRLPLLEKPRCPLSFPPMKIHRLLAAILLSACAAQADVVTDWNETALQAIRTDKTSPPKASRALAILHTAIYDAINGITQTHERYLVSGKPAGVASPEAAASAAGHLVLVRLFPAQQTAIDTAHNKALSAIPNSLEKNAGIHWGEWAANILLVARSTDGAEETMTYLPKTAPGEWMPTEPKNAPALLPQWQKVACFVMTSGAQFRPPRPPALTSAVYAFDVNLTKQIGGRDSKERTPEQTMIAQFWADGPGTVTPPGHWNVIARDVAAQRSNTMEQNAKLFALLNIALADAAICCWDCKFDVKLWRPITAIRDADTDNNPATDKDPAWTPLLETPPFPEYTSGHSTFSSAAATVLAAFFGSDNIAISVTSEAIPGFSRNYKSFSEAAAEAGMSRIFGGIHFMTANREGLSSGARLGSYVMENFLREKRAASAQLRAAHASRVLVAASRRDELSETSNPPETLTQLPALSEVHFGGDAETNPRDARAPKN